MKIVDLLTKSIILIYREHLHDNVDSLNDSVNLVTNILTHIGTIDTDNGLPLQANSFIPELIDLLVEKLDEPSGPINKEIMLNSINIITKDNDRVNSVLTDAINNDLSEGLLHKSILDLKRYLVNYFKEKKIIGILKKSYFDFSKKRTSIKNINEYINTLILRLEALELQSTNKDDKIVSEVDISDTSALTKVITEIADVSNSKGVMRFGWQGLNDMLQGGIKRGEFMVVSALQHNYKTGVTLSIFEQIALYNTPYMYDDKKKPLLLRISFEDDLTNNIEFMYLYLKHDETRKHVTIKNVSVEVMAEYIKERLGVNGYNMKVLRVNPSEWTYQDIFRKIIELEAQGFEIHLLMLDYLAMVPTTGCKSSGAMGTDIKDLFMRVRNFCSLKKIAVITPHQISTDAKQLLRNGLPPELFVKEIANKGYYAGTRQLDQEVDVELYIHKVVKDKKAYLTIQRGKHRTPTIIDDDRLFMVLPFPRGMPIPGDIDKVKSHTKGLPSNTNDDFGF